jgi:hypothetical protein
MKTTLYLLGGITVCTVGFLAIRSQVPPNFSVQSIDYLKKEIDFVFSGNRNMVSFGRGFGVGGRNGYTLTTGSQDGKSIYFKLYKHGKFIQTLRTVNFN